MPLFHSHREPPVEPVLEDPVPQKHGLFHSRREPPVVDPVAADTTVPRKHSIFSSRRDPSPVRTVSSASSSGHSTGPVRSKRGSLFHRDRDSLSASAGAAEEDAAIGRSPGLLHKGLGRMGMGSHDVLDPSIVRAREHVMSAEAAEAEADRALDEAKRRVREAREHVKRLEEEAAEDARRARIKQHHAAEVSKRGKVLGRKYNH